MSYLVLNVLLSCIMSLMIILPSINLNNLQINKKLFLTCFFINFIPISVLHLNTRDIAYMIILLFTSFIYLNSMYKNVMYSILIIVFINVVISISDHITEFLFANCMGISTFQINSNIFFYFTFAFVILLISCIMCQIFKTVFFKTKKICTNFHKSKNK